MLIFFDAALPYQITMQDSATPIHEGLLNLYEDLMSLLVGLFGFVFVFLFDSAQRFIEDHNQVKVVQTNYYIKPERGYFTRNYFTPGYLLVVSHTALEFI
jgi:hypothetical protein